jgi:uncharacterized protein YdeI (YjbR/CyaY-like superfamily)
VTTTSREPKELLLPDVAAWRDWLATNHERHDGVRLVLAKKGSLQPTSLTHAQALTEALCQGWIDGQASPRNDVSWCVRFTPRRRRSLWSKRNVGLVEHLIADGRMQPAGLAEVERAKADGRWAAAYSGQADMEVPEDLAAALAATPGAAEMFQTLNRQNRFAILYRLATAKRPETRDRRIREFLSMLARGKSLYSQRASGSRP